MTDYVTDAAPNWLPRVEVADTNYTVPSFSGVLIAYTSLTAARVINLPPATTKNQLIRVVDETGNCTATVSLTLTPNGTDTIEGRASRALDYPYASLQIESNGAGKWVIITNPSPQLSAGIKVQPSFTDNLNGSITLGSGTYALYTNVDGIGKIKTYVIAGGTYTLTDATTNYVVANYNSGTPTIQVITDVTLINETTIIPVFTIYRNGTTLYDFEWDLLGDALVNKIHKSIVKTQRYRRESGLALGEAATRLVTIGSGTVWTGAVPTTLAAFNSSVNPLIFAYHVAGVWTFSTVTQYNNTQYDDGTNLQTTPGGKYVVNFIYRGVGNDTDGFYVLGNQAYSLGDALASQPPSLPSLISSHCILVGRIIVSQGASTATDIASAFVTTFTPTPALDHNSLAGLQGGTTAQYYHLTSAEYTGTGTGNFVRASGPSIATPTFTTSATFSYLTSGRIPYSTTGGSLIDSANLTWTTGGYLAVFAASSGAGGISLNDSGSGQGRFIMSLDTSGNGQMTIRDASNVDRIYLDASATASSTISGTLTSDFMKMSTANPDYLGLTITATTGTNCAGEAYINTGGRFFQGIDNSTGSRVTGAGTYAAYLWVESAIPLQFATNNTKRMEILSTGEAKFYNPPITPVYTVAGLPTGTEGMRAGVSDANSTTFASVVAGGGTNHVPVYFNGTNWIIG